VLLFGPAYSQSLITQQHTNMRLKSEVILLSNILVIFSNRSFQNTKMNNNFVLLCLQKHYVLYKTHFTR
jgi:hypothetical protein